MPGIEAKSTAYEPLSDGDLSVTAMQLFQFHRNNPGIETANVFYKSCAFAIDLMNGSVKQQFVKRGAVNSIIKSGTANDYADQLKQAHHLAAMMAVLEGVRAIKDNKLQAEITNITTKNPAMTADQVLSKLSMGQQSNLSSFSLFSQVGAVAKSPALMTVRKLLASLSGMITLGAADNVCKQLANDLQAVSSPEPKR